MKQTLESRVKNKNYIGKSDALLLLYLRLILLIILTNIRQFLISVRTSTGFYCLHLIIDFALISFFCVCVFFFLVDGLLHNCCVKLCTLFVGCARDDNCALAVGCVYTVCCCPVFIILKYINKTLLETVRCRC